MKFLPQVVQGFLTGLLMLLASTTYWLRPQLWAELSSGQSSVPPPLGLPEGRAVFPLKSGLSEPIFMHLHKIRTFYVLFGIAHKITMYFIRMKGAMCPFKTSSGVRRILYFSCLSHWMLNTDIYFEFF